ncbi:helix-turn-helix transcriptional regulator [Streptosporangiaceae bacterium NEAU-GS5]|nr:helix-turn-helix transcriptional regulator [Streptosporangiaceae bacterium NEAU-GS5]
MAGQPLFQAAQIFGERVRSRRLALGMSQEQLADAIGLHWTFVGQVERGQRNISLRNILKLAEGLEIDPGELVAGLRGPSSAPA